MEQEQYTLEEVAKDKSKIYGIIRLNLKNRLEGATSKVEKYFEDLRASIISGEMQELKLADILDEGNFFDSFSQDDINLYATIYPELLESSADEWEIELLKPLQAAIENNQLQTFELAVSRANQFTKIDLSDMPSNFIYKNITPFFTNGSTKKTIVFPIHCDTREDFSIKELLQDITAKKTCIKELVFDLSLSHKETKSAVLDFMLSPQNSFCQITLSKPFYLPKDESATTINARLTKALTELDVLARHGVITKEIIDYCMKAAGNISRNIKWPKDDLEGSLMITKYMSKLWVLEKALPLKEAPLEDMGPGWCYDESELESKEPAVEYIGGGFEAEFLPTN